jgi:hypothetical protein
MRTSSQQIQVCPNTQPLLCGGWPIPDKLYDTLDECFDIDRILHSNPYNLPLRAQTYYSEDPLNTLFTSESLTDTTWTGTSMPLPEFQPSKLTTALEQAIYNAHTHKKPHPKPNHPHTPRLETYPLPCTESTHQLRIARHHNSTHTSHPTPAPPQIQLTHLPRGELKSTNTTRRYKHSQHTKHIPNPRIRTQNPNTQD